jgi:thioredoxin-related protein
MNANAILRGSKVSHVLPDGLKPQKTKIAWDESLSEPSGWVVRYTSRGCIYCNLDFEWERLTPLLEHLNYRTILLLPRETDQYDEDWIIPETAQQMAFVRMDWIKQFRFSATPTLVIYDKNGRVLWHRIGMLNEDDYQSAEKAVLRNTSTRRITE